MREASLIRYSDKYLNSALRDLWAYDPVTGLFTWKIRTKGGGRAIQIGDEAGVISRGYVVLNHHGLNYFAHVLAWVWQTGALPPLGSEIDHRDRIKHHNWESNLRLLNHGSNMTNREGHRGVYRQMNQSGWTGRYIARITVDGEIVNLGVHKTFEEAVASRQWAEAEFWKLTNNDG
jgi:hypothetical protein